MPSSFRIPLLIAALPLSTVFAAAQAPTPRVRPEGAALQERVAELSDRSPTARSLLDTLESSDALVYIRYRAFTDSLLDGRTGLLRCAGPTRYIVVELASNRRRNSDLETLGHELRHAVEIATSPDVVDLPTLSALYHRIGTRVDVRPHAEMFETRAAQDTARQIRRELYAAVARTTHDRQ